MRLYLKNYFYTRLSHPIMSGSKKVKASKAKSASKTTKVVESTPVEESAPVDPTTQEFESVLSEFTTLTAQLKTLSARVRTLQKQYTKVSKASSKRGKKSGGSKTVSGFATPTKISNELCSFMGLQSGTEVARTEVTKYLSKYIKDHELQDAKNRRVIVPDKKLGKLLNVGKSDSVTYFNLQKYMKPHFSSKSASA